MTMKVEWRQFPALPLSSRDGFAPFVPNHVLVYSEEYASKMGLLPGLLAIEQAEDEKEKMVDDRCFCAQFALGMLTEYEEMVQFMDDVLVGYKEIQAMEVLVTGHDYMSSASYMHFRISSEPKFQWTLPEQKVWRGAYGSICPTKTEFVIAYIAKYGNLVVDVAMNSDKKIHVSKYPNLVTKAKTYLDLVNIQSKKARKTVVASPVSVLPDH